MYTVEELVALPWNMELARSGDAWCGRVPELPGCLAEGGTPNQAAEQLEESIRAWLEAMVALEPEFLRLVGYLVAKSLHGVPQVLEELRLAKP